MEILKLLIRVIPFLLVILLKGCSQGWSVGGVQLTPQDSVSNSVFIEIVGIDSSLHYYHERVYQSQNWCWIHHQFEDVKLINE